MKLLVGRGHVPAVCRNYRLRTGQRNKIATTGVRTGLAMTDRVTYYVIARALAPVAISCRQLVVRGIPDAPM